MSLRRAAALFFLLYGALIPFTAGGFMETSRVAGLAIIGCCVVLAALFWLGRALLLNLLLAFYVLTRYLTRPYLAVFLAKLTGRQFAYISALNYYDNPRDAAVVYLSLLSLLAAWFLGLLMAKPRDPTEAPAPWIFRQADAVIRAAGWPFWLVWASLAWLNYQSATVTWQAISMGQGSGLFAWGLLSTTTIDAACLFAVLQSRRPGARPVPLTLLIPILASAVLGSIGGQRGAVYYAAVLTSLYWAFINVERRINARDVRRLLVLAVLAPLAVYGALVAQQIRPLLRTGADAATVWQATKNGLDLADPANPVASNLYFGLSQLLQRVSDLRAQFLILNDHFVTDPWRYYNPLANLKGTINAVLPGSLKPFPGLIGINQLFDYVYLGNNVIYSSQTWGIQGTFYLYFGLWLSPLVVFFLGRWAGRGSPRLEFLARTSPAFAAFFILLLNEALDFGTIERIVPVDVVRPLVAFLALILMVKPLQFIVPGRRRGPPAPRAP